MTQHLHYQSIVWRHPLNSMSVFHPHDDWHCSFSLKESKLHINTHMPMWFTVKIYGNEHKTRFSLLRYYIYLLCSWSLCIHLSVQNLSFLWPEQQQQQQPSLFWFFKSNAIRCDQFFLLSFCVPPLQRTREQQDQHLGPPLISVPPLHWLALL